MPTAATLWAYTAAVLLIVLSPGPDNILVISRGLSMGRRAAVVAALGCSLGVAGHGLAAAWGLSLLLQATPWAFMALKLAGGTYLLWLGWQALRQRSLIEFTRTAHLPLWRVGQSSLLTNLLNPKVALFMIAFMPPFVDTARGPAAPQMLLLGGIYAGITVVVYAAMGWMSASLTQALRRRPRVVTGLNLGVGALFIAAGASILATSARR